MENSMPEVRNFNDPKITRFAALMDATLQGQIHWLDLRLSRDFTGVL